jgi:hypothetical protein
MSRVVIKNTNYYSAKLVAFLLQRGVIHEESVLLLT